MPYNRKVLTIWNLHVSGELSWTTALNLVTSGTRERRQFSRCSSQILLDLHSPFVRSWLICEATPRILGPLSFFRRQNQLILCPKQWPFPAPANCPDAAKRPRPVILPSWLCFTNATNRIIWWEETSKRFPTSTAPTPAMQCCSYNRAVQFLGNWGYVLGALQTQGLHAMGATPSESPVLHTQPSFPTSSAAHTGLPPGYMCHTGNSPCHAHSTLTLLLSGHVTKAAHLLHATRAARLPPSESSVHSQHSPPNVWAAQAAWTPHAVPSIPRTRDKNQSRRKEGEPRDHTAVAARVTGRVAKGWGEPTGHLTPHKPSVE